MLQVKVEEEKTMWIKEHEEDRFAYQKLLDEKYYVESQFYNVSQEFNQVWQSCHCQSLSNASSVSDGTDDVHEEESIFNDYLEVAMHHDGIDLILSIVVNFYLASRIQIFKAQGFYEW